MKATENPISLSYQILGFRPFVFGLKYPTFNVFKNPKNAFFKNLATNMQAIPQHLDQN